MTRHLHQPGADRGGGPISQPPVITRRLFSSAILAATSVSVHAQTASDPLPSWRDGAAKQAILQFIRATTDPSSPEFVPPEERIAEFDQDGTLWVEHPLYTQVVYCFDRVGPLVKQKPELKAKEPFKTVLSGNREAIAKLSMREMFEIVLLTQSGMTVEDYRADVRQWLATAKHPRWNRPYTELVYQPMLELLSLLRANGFKNFIATGGSGSFVREYSSKVYDIPPERVSGTGQADAFGHDKDGKPILTQEPRLVLNNLGAGKIENFWLTYGRRPRLAFGNSSSDDQQMLEYVKAGSGARLSAAVLHDDATREYAYGPAQGLPDTSVGTFSQAMYDMAIKQGWIVVSMKNDWARLFPFEA
jgi:phosphoglycolate phosphatase-like HAD superfamily hydrolase